MKPLTTIWGLFHPFSAKKLADLSLFSPFAGLSERLKNNGIPYSSYCSPGVASANPGFHTSTMALKKCFLFIDGSNLYHGLKQNKIYDYFRYDWFYSELSKKFDIQKVFFYDAIKSIKIEPVQYAAQQRFHERLKKWIPGLVIRHRKLKYIRVDNRVENAKKNTAFCNPCKIKLEEFLKVSGLHKLSKEKGIDIQLVADMIKGAFQEKYELALLLTGDADFVPAVELVQLLKKDVVNIHCYAGSSSELRNACDSHIKIDADAKGVCFLKYY